MSGAFDLDDLGRVVIPKEIRRTLRIREGDPLEIFTTQDGEVIFKKYSVANINNENIQSLAAAFYETTQAFCAVCDTDKVIAIYGKDAKRIKGSRITDELLEELRARETAIKTEEYQIKVFEYDDYVGDDRQIIVPIISEYEVIGGIVVYATTENHHQIVMLAEFMARTIGKNVES